MYSIHPSHKMRYSDSSIVDAVCEYCHEGDPSTGTNAALAYPCFGTSYYIERVESPTTPYTAYGYYLKDGKKIRCVSPVFYSEKEAKAWRHSPESVNVHD